MNTVISVVMVWGQPTSVFWVARRDDYYIYIYIYLLLLTILLTMKRRKMQELEIYLLWQWPRKITGHYVSGNKKNIYPDSLLNFWTVWSIIGHLAYMLLNDTSALFRPLVLRIVEVEHMRHVKNDL